MTDIDTRAELLSEKEASAAPDTVLDTYQAACVWPARPAQRIVVITSRSSSHTVVSAVEEMLTGDQTMRWVEQGLHTAHGSDVAAPPNDLTAWWDWADVVVTEARDESIAECVVRGFIPVVAMPKRHRDPLGARRALRTVHPWSSRGLALQLCLTKPAAGVLQAAVGVRAQLSGLSTISHHAA